MPPQRAADGTHARASGTLLPPQRLARSGDFVTRLGRRRSAPHARQVMPHRFVQQRFIDVRAEHRVGQLHAADLLIAQIDNVYLRHGYFLALLTITYPPFGPGTAPLISSTFSSGSTSTISRLRTVTRVVPICPDIFIPGKTRDGKLDAPIEPGARWNMEPCPPGPPLKWWPRTTPAKPLPLLMPITSTLSFGLNSSTSTRSPVFISPLEPLSRRNSRWNLTPSAPDFFRCPASGFESLDFLTYSIRPNCTASYPSVCGVLRCTTTHGPALSTVTGTTCPSARNTCVIPIFFPKIPGLMGITPIARDHWPLATDHSPLLLAF